MWLLVPHRADRAWREETFEADAWNRHRARRQKPSWQVACPTISPPRTGPKSVGKRVCWRPIRRVPASTALPETRGGAASSVYLPAMALVHPKNPNCRLSLPDIRAMIARGPVARPTWTNSWQSGKLRIRRSGGRAPAANHPPRNHRGRGPGAFRRPAAAAPRLACSDRQRRDRSAGHFRGILRSRVTARR